MELIFTDADGKQITLQAELPKELQVTLLQLRKHARQKNTSFR
jgi:hypothetical protein